MPFFHRRRPARGSAGAVAALTAVYAAQHSLLAARPLKALVARWVGTRTRNGCYRFAYIVQSVLSTVWAVRVFARLPDRELYRVRAPWAWAMHAVQGTGAGLLLWGLSVVGFGRLLGLTSLAAFLRGRTPPPEPEAQGPPPTAAGEPRLAGPFRVIRHPDNLFFVFFLWFLPRMTVNRLTLAVLCTAYAVLGSWHEDHRMRAAYGEPFARYQRRVPLMVPGGRRRSADGAAAASARGPGSR